MDNEPAENDEACDCPKCQLKEALFDILAEAGVVDEGNEDEIRILDPNMMFKVLGNTLVEVMSGFNKEVVERFLADVMIGVTEVQEEMAAFAAEAEADVEVEDEGKPEDVRLN